MRCRVCLAFFWRLPSAAVLTSVTLQSNTLKIELYSINRVSLQGGALIMSLAYQIMYRLGITPWERRQPPQALGDLIEGPRALPAGHMLDIGCGTGHYAIYCALHGWTVTAVDAVGRALEAARHNAHQAGAKIRCLHGLPDRALRQAVATITDAAKPGATLLMFAFASGKRGQAPRGIDPARVPALFPRWELTFSRPATEVRLSGPMRNANPTWYQLIRR